MKLIKNIVFKIVISFVFWLGISSAYCLLNGITFSKGTGVSMEPTLKEGEFRFNKKIFADEVERFDIILFHHDEKTLGKRVLGLPGETIVLDHNNLYIDGKLIDQPFEYYAVNDEIDSYVWSCTLADDEYFFVGDNRTNSKDSRFFGPVKADQIAYKHIEHFTNNKILNFVFETPYRILSPILLAIPGYL